MALTLLAHAWVQAHGGQLITLTVDHGLRTESAAEAEQVAGWMRARGIEHHILTPPHDASSNNVQEAARQRRYDALADFCRARGILHCLLAHHAGDNRETVAHNTARGDTADGASGMVRARNYRGARFLRPLLTVERAQLEDFLRAQNVAWVDDPSNRNQRFARVRTRELLAKDMDLRDALDAQLAQGSAARTARDHALADVAMRLVTLHPLGFAEFSLAAWRMLEPNIASQLLADCITTISGAATRPRAGDTARIATALHADNFRKRSVQHCELTLTGDTLRIAREAARVAAPIPLSGSGECLWDNRFRAKYDLPDQRPITLRALGADGRKQLKTHHAQRPTPNALPLATPSLWHLDELLCVPHITPASSHLPTVRIGFAPPKPLAAAPFW